MANYFPAGLANLVQELVKVPAKQSMTKTSGPGPVCEGTANDMVKYEPGSADVLKGAENGLRIVNKAKAYALASCCCPGARVRMYTYVMETRVENNEPVGFCPDIPGIMDICGECVFDNVKVRYYDKPPFANSLFGPGHFYKFKTYFTLCGCCCTTNPACPCIVDACDPICTQYDNVCMRPCFGDIVMHSPADSLCCVCCCAQPVLSCLDNGDRAVASIHESLSAFRKKVDQPMPTFKPPIGGKVAPS